MTEINLTPDYRAIFGHMLAEARRQAEGNPMFLCCGMQTQAEALRDCQRWFAPLTLAIQCATSVTEIEQVRSLMGDILAEINRQAFAEEEKALRRR